MSSTCFERECSSSGRRLYIRVWYSMFYRYQYKHFSLVVGRVWSVLKQCVRYRVSKTHSVPNTLCHL